MYNVFFTLQGEKGDMGAAGPIGPQGIPVRAEPEHTLTFQILISNISNNVSKPHLSALKWKIDHQ